MTLDSLILTLAFLSFLIFFLCFFILTSKRGTFPIRNILISFICGLIVCITVSGYISSAAFPVLIAQFIYGLLVSVYIFAIYLNFDSSVHIRIFQIIAKKEAQGISYSSLLRNYNKRIILKKRLTWLINSKEIGKKGNIFYLCRRFSFLGLREKFLVLLAKLYGTEGEFNILLLFIILGAFIVRVWGINFGLPNMHFGDEQFLAYWTFYSASHFLRPAYYLYAPLVPMVLMIEFSLYFVLGFLIGHFSSFFQFFVSFLSDPTVFILLGRITIAFSGTVAVWLVFKVGKTFFSRRVGMLAAFFLAFSFLHVKESHYIKQDVLMGGFVLAAFYFSLEIFLKHRVKDYILCGISLGLAFATKYQALLFFPIFFVAHSVGNRKLITKNLILFGLSFFLIFSLIHPYFILEPQKTFTKTLSDSAGTLVVYAEHLLGRQVWWWFMFEHIPQGIGYPLFITAILGFAFCLLNIKSNKLYFFIPFLPFLFFITIDKLTALHFARYAIILLPFFVLADAIFIDFIQKKLNLNRWLIILLILVLIFPSLRRTIQFNTLLTKPDTRTLAKAWFEEAVSADTKVLVESTVKPETPSNFNASLALDSSSIETRIFEAQNRGQEALYLRALKQANQNKIGYDIVATTQVGALTDIYTDQLTRINNVDYYVKNKIMYILLTSWVQEKMTPDFERSLNSQYDLIKIFKPTYEFKNDPHLVQVNYPILDQVDIFRAGIVFGPEIRIYKLKS